MKNNITIREEEPKDYKIIYELVKAAFEHAEHTDYDEQNLVTRLRKCSDYIKELALVAEFDGKIIGYIMFTTAKVGEETVIVPAPLAIIPEMQGQGIGAELIKKAHEIAKNMGYEFSVLVGHESYYPKFAYLPASGFGIKCPFEVPNKCFMAYNLQGKSRKIDGTLEYNKAFFDIE